MMNRKEVQRNLERISTRATDIIEQELYSTEDIGRSIKALAVDIRDITEILKIMNYTRL